MIAGGRKEKRSRVKSNVGSYPYILTFGKTFWCGKDVGVIKNTWSEHENAVVFSDSELIVIHVCMLKG